VALGGRGVLAGQWVQHSIAIDATGAPVMQTGHVHGSGWDWCHFDKAEALVEQAGSEGAPVMATELDDATAGVVAVVAAFEVLPRLEGGCGAAREVAARSGGGIHDPPPDSTQPLGSRERRG
jgi:hypothetical protein